ncbi:small multi-drug export protein [Candidatus Woesearchaeota archaeon]|nr:small multi-drug export protein [Candidatus Woesearchaeota archaeon]
MSLLNVIGLSVFPISELRGGIPVGIAQGFNPLLVFFVAVISNFLAIPLTFFFLDYLHDYFTKMKLYNNIFSYYIKKNRNKLENKIGTKAEFMALLIFVGIPFPLTGAYSGSILAWFFGMNRKMAYLSITFGIILAGLIVLITTLGLFSLF